MIIKAPITATKSYNLPKWLFHYKLTLEERHLFTVFIAGRLFEELAREYRGEWIK
jgi:hypothetical protein